MTHAQDLAYPVQESDQNGGSQTYFGLTKREYFAACALQGMLANPTHECGTRATSESAVMCADDLIAALNKPV